jgi:hypothetical protein
LQLTADYKVATPANWKDGDDVVISPAIKRRRYSSEIPKRFSKNKILFKDDTAT